MKELTVNPLTGELEPNLQGLINSMKQHGGIMPMVSSPHTISSIGVINEGLTPYQLIEYAGDLLAIGKINQAEWFRLKALSKTASEENMKLVAEILNAKSTDNK